MVLSLDDSPDCKLHRLLKREHSKRKFIDSDTKSTKRNDIRLVSETKRSLVSTNQTFFSVSFKSESTIGVDYKLNHCYKKKSELLGGQNLCNKVIILTNDSCD